MLSQGRIDEIVKNEAEEDADILNDVLIGWDDGTFKDESGSDLLFNEDNKDLILSVPYVRGALVKGFFESIAGKQFKRKNLIIPDYGGHLKSLSEAEINRFSNQFSL